MAQILESTQKQISRILTALQISFSSPYGICRVFNTVVNKIQAELKMEYLFAMPHTFAIEITNCCNSNCVLCPVGEGYKSRPFGYMSWDRFRRIIDEISQYATFIGLYNWGEPLLHPRVYDMIKYVAAHGVHTSVSTNLHAFRTDDAERLVKTGLNKLGVACHGLTQKTYSTYQPGKKLDIFIEKIKAIVDAKHRLNSKTPEINLDFIVRKDNEHEIVMLPDFAKRLEVGYLLEEVSLNLRFIGLDEHMQPRKVSEEKLCQERLARMKQWLPKDDSRVNPFYLRIRENNGRIPQLEKRLFKCTFPWHHMIICWDGDVNLCCGSFEKKHSVGNVFEESIRKIWNNKYYQAARRSILNRHRKNDVFVLCDTCPGMLL